MAYEEMTVWVDMGKIQFSNGTGDVHVLGGTGQYTILFHRHPMYNRGGFVRFTWLPYLGSPDTTPPPNPQPVFVHQISPNYDLLTVTVNLAANGDYKYTLEFLEPGAKIPIVEDPEIQNRHEMGPR